MDRLSELLPAGPPIAEEQQIGRSPLIDSVEERLRGGDVLIIADARRVGKTSVARAALARLGATGCTVAEVNLASHGSDHLGAASALAAMLASGFQRPAHELGKVVRRLRKTGVADDGGSEGGALLAAAAELLGASRRIDNVVAGAAHRAVSGCCAIFFDEAHVIAAWPDEVQEAFNVALRDSGALGVIVASSERSALERLLDEGQPLYMAGYRMPLPVIDPETWAAGLAPRFAELGAEVDAAGLDLIVVEARCHPYCTMRLANETALQAEKGRQLTGADQLVIDELAVQAALIVVREDLVWKAVIG